MNKIKFDHVRTQLIAFLWKIIHDWSFSLGSLVAYYLVLSLLPLLLAVFSISLMLFGGNVELQQIIRDRLVKAFPEQSLTELVDALQKSMKDQAWAIFIISLIVAIFGGSRLIIGIDDSLTIIYRIRERTILQQNIHAIKMLLIFIIFLPLIIVSSSVTAVLKEKEVFYYFLSTLSSGLFTFILFNLIYYYVPAREMKFRNTWCGSLIAAVGLMILFLLFPIYVHLFMTNYVGNLGFIIIALLLFYIMGLILIIGAQINSFFFENIQPLPTGLGNCLSAYANRENTPLINGEAQLNNNNILTLTDNINPPKELS